MYEHFFGFTAKPFENSHDADQYFLGAAQQQALVSIHAGLEKNGGFIIITGPTGVGKTSTIEFLKKEQENSNLNIAGISANKVSDLNLLPTILTAFNCPISDLKLSVLISQIETFIHSQLKNGKKTLLIIDDAQSLSNRCLDVLRLLSNFKSNGRPSFQVVLVGNNELKQRLMEPNFVSLRSQIVLSIEMQPMDLIGTKNYVMHHLKRVGWRNKPKMSGKLLELTHNETQGLPVAINYFFDEYLKQEAQRASEVESSVLEFPAKTKTNDYNKDALIAALESMESHDTQDVMCNAFGAESAALNTPSSTSNAQSSTLNTKPLHDTADPHLAQSIQDTAGEARPEMNYDQTSARNVNPQAQQQGYQSTQQPTYQNSNQQSRQQIHQEAQRQAQQQGYQSTQQPTYQNGNQQSRQQIHQEAQRQAQQQGYQSTQQPTYQNSSQQSRQQTHQQTHQQAQEFAASQSNDTYNFNEELSLEETKRFFENGNGAATHQQQSDDGSNWKLVSVIFGAYILSAVLAVSMYFSDVKISELSINDMIMAVEAEASTVVSLH